VPIIYKGLKTTA
jgi:hypothetical protein